MNFAPRTFALLLTTLALLGCATSPPRAADDVTAINFGVSSWGHTQEQWTVTASGEATLAMAPPDAPFDAEMAASAGRISPEDFARLRAAIAPMQRYVGVELPCTNMIYDAPSLTLHWVRADATEARVGYYMGCSETPQRREIAAAMAAADRIFHEATGLGRH